MKFNMWPAKRTPTGAGCRFRGYPSSVVDVRCGSGAWLHIFQKYGAGRILGLDGHPQGLFPRGGLEPAVSLAEFFEVAICWEVAEHLPKQSAPALIESLVRLVLVVLFSAAKQLQAARFTSTSNGPPTGRTCLKSMAIPCWTGSARKFGPDRRFDLGTGRTSSVCLLGILWRPSHDSCRLEPSLVI